MSEVFHFSILDFQNQMPAGKFGGFIVSRSLKLIHKFCWNFYLVKWSFGSKILLINIFRIQLKDFFEMLARALSHSDHRLCNRRTIELKILKTEKC